MVEQPRPDQGPAGPEQPGGGRPELLAGTENAALRDDVPTVPDRHHQAEDVLEDGPKNDQVDRSTLASGQRLGRYEIADCIGSGGMGEVYRARDTRLGRQVAIKVLPAALGRDAARRQRFEDEARAASALNHPNVLTVYDVGTLDDEGSTFIVMELLEGETLRRRLEREPRLTRLEVIDYGGQVARGLTAAHAGHIVHRDLKPENLFITTDGRVKILDFGVAKLARTDDVTRAGTQHGAVIGTAGYMAPEQVRGEPVDARADTFAFGAVLFEMLSGRRAFSGRSSIDTIMPVLHTDPLTEPGATIVADADLLAIVKRCLAKEPTDRYQRAADVVAALDQANLQRSAPPRRGRTAVRTAAVALALIVTVGVTWTMRRTVRSEPAINAPREFVLAVMPFENIAADQSQQYFTAGVTEEIGAQLARLSALRVMSRTAVARYATAADGPQRLRQDLGVRAVLTGSVRIAGERTRISVQLVDTVTGQSLWAQQYDQRMEDILQLQSDVATQIAAAVQARISGDEKERMARPATTSAAAYQLYLKARAPLSRPERIAILQQAIGIDPDFSAAYAGMSRLQGELGDFGDRRYYDESLASARRAIDVDGNEPRAHHALAVIQLRRGRLAEARLEFLRALELAPNFADAAWDISVTDSSLGRNDESLFWARRGFTRAPNVSTASYHVAIPLLNLADAPAAQRFLLEAEKRFPAAPRIQYLLSWNEFVAGNPDTALARIRRAFEGNQDNGEVHAVAAALTFSAGTNDAAAHVASLFQKSPGARTYVLGATVRAMHAYLLLKAGDTTRGTALMNEALAAADKERTEGSELPDVPLEIAAIHAVRGERDEAIRWLESAYQAGWRLFRELDRDPFFASLRADPDYRRIRQRMEEDVRAMRQRVNVNDNPQMPPLSATASLPLSK
jgi:eukaryotic-like serine/threonine-protein kinase